MTRTLALLALWAHSVGTLAQPLAPPSQRPADLTAVIDMVENGRMNEAQARLEAMLAETETAAARDLLGVVFSRGGRLEAAEDQFRRAIALDPTSLSARQHLGRLYVQLERPREALSALREAAALGPLERDLALQLAAAEIANGNPDAGERQLRSVVERFGSVRALLDLARLQVQRSDQQEATASLRRALEIAPNSEEVLSAVARLSLARREPVPAIQALEPLTRMHPTVAEHAYLLGVARLQIGENEGAVETLERALELEPDRAQTLTALGLALLSQKRFADARDAMRRSLELGAGNVEALAGLAEAEEGLGELDAAERHAQAALARATNHSGALLVIGKVRMNQRRYEEARDALLQAVAADSSSSKAHYQLSLAYSRLGDADSSKRHLELYREALRAAEEYLIELRTKAGLGQSGMKR